MTKYRLEVPVWASIEITADTMEDALKQAFELSKITIQTSWRGIETDVTLNENATLLTDPNHWAKVGYYDPEREIEVVG